MPWLRLLTSIQGDGPVTGDPGDELEVSSKLARIWGDGERALIIPEPTGQVSTVVETVMEPVPVPVVVDPLLEPVLGPEPAVLSAGCRRR